jgi:hypothetical protein
MSVVLGEEVVSAVGKGRSRGDWWLRLELATEGSLLGGLHHLLGVRRRGGVDLKRSPRDLVFVHIQKYPRKIFHCQKERRKDPTKGRWIRKDSAPLLPPRGQPRGRRRRREGTRLRHFCLCLVDITIYLLDSLPICWVS